LGKWRRWENLEFPQLFVSHTWNLITCKSNFSNFKELCSENPLSENRVCAFRCGKFFFLVCRFSELKFSTQWNCKWFFMKMQCLEKPTIILHSPYFPIIQNEHLSCSLDTICQSKFHSFYFILQHFHYNLLDLLFNFGLDGCFVHSIYVDMENFLNFVCDCMSKVFFFLFWNINANGLCWKMLYWKGWC
jgi:hypothetical protein